jgi:hypothetical protein
MQTRGADTFVCRVESVSTLFPSASKAALVTKIEGVDAGIESPPARPDLAHLRKASVELGVFEILQRRGLGVYLVNARHTKNLPGRKTDIQECQWLLKLHFRTAEQQFPTER